MKCFSELVNILFFYYYFLHFSLFDQLIFLNESLFVCGGSLTSGQLVKGSFQTD